MSHKFSAVSVCFPRINSFTKLTSKCPYGKMSYGKVSLRRSVFIAKGTHSEVPLQRNVLTAKCPYGEVYVRWNVRRSVLIQCYRKSLIEKVHLSMMLRCHQTLTVPFKTEWWHTKILTPKAMSLDCLFMSAIKCCWSCNKIALSSKIAKIKQCKAQTTNKRPLKL